MITYLKLAIFLTVFGVALIATSAQAGDKDVHEGKVKVSKVNSMDSTNSKNSIIPQSSSRVSHATEMSRNRALQALVRYEERMAERSAELEAEKAISKTEQQAQEIYEQDADDTSEKNNPVISSTTPVEASVVEPSLGF